MSRYVQAVRQSLGTALIVTRREVRDTLRDWRMVVPILVLTLFFPLLMSATAQFAMNWLASYGAPLIGTRLVPFLLLIVGFFPISFSLVIALETFVGERERHSLEPLLAMPLSDGELYLGKMLAATVVPLLASYLGIVVYMVGLFLTIGYFPPIQLLIQIFLLTTAEALVMVAGAVIVSSQTTSVRAANLLASFIIVPMALLMQVEAAIMFWARYDVLWIILAALLVANLILIRMGVRLFNREELLGREFDQIQLRRMARQFRRFFLQSPDEALLPWADEPLRVDVVRWYRRDIPALLGRHRFSIVMVLVLMLASLALGWAYAPRYPLPVQALDFGSLSRESLGDMTGLGFLPAFSPWHILLFNLRSLALGALLALFSFGVLAFLPLISTMGIVGFLAYQVTLAGYHPLLFMAVFILPHGWLELPAVILVTAFALRLGASIMAPPGNLTVGDSLLLALADFFKVTLLVAVPMLVAAAFLEVYLTPQIVLWFFGGR
ncbi:MAG: stage II sporulation protein M [Chloroflexota bacterium]